MNRRIGGAATNDSLQVACSVGGEGVSRRVKDEKGGLVVGHPDEVDEAGGRRWR